MLKEKAETTIVANCFTPNGNFNNTAVSKANTAGELSGHAIGDHFVSVNKMVELDSGSQCEIDGIMLTRYACYLLKQLPFGLYLTFNFIPYLRNTKK